jgi:prevent-host-death family protein
MIKANVFDVKAQLSEYLDRAAKGERVVICRHNTPVAELRAVEHTRTEPRPIGPLPGRPTFEIDASFFDPLSDDELALWEGPVASRAPVSARMPRASRGVSRVAEPKATYGAKRPTRRRS